MTRFSPMGVGDSKLNGWALNSVLVRWEMRYA